MTNKKKTRENWTDGRKRTESLTACHYVDKQEDHKIKGKLILFPFNADLLCYKEVENSGFS